MKIPVTCPHCNQITPVPAEKIPPKPVTFPCPGCSGKVPIDGSKIKEMQEAPPVAEAPAPAPPAPEPPPPQAPPPERVAEADRSGPIASPAPPPQDAGTRLGDIDLLEHVELAEGATLPPGFLIVDDPKAQDALEKSLASMGSELKLCESVAMARELTTMHLPPMMIYLGGKIAAPPLDLLSPITNLEPIQRRRTFLVLVADTVRTLDGNAAFFYDVDLVINTKDCDRAHLAIFSALEFDNTLRGSFLEDLTEIEGV